MQEKNRDTFLALLMLVGSCIAISPLVPYVFKTTGNIVSLLACVIFMTVVLTGHWRGSSRIGGDPEVIRLCLFVIGIGFVNSLYWHAFTVRVLVYFLAAILVASYSSKSVVIRFVDIATKLHVWVLLFSIVGYFYAYYGGSPVFEIHNEDGRSNGFYLSTFSNTYLYGVIRASGFYDEPGALSFMVCLIVALRELLHLDRRRSWALIWLGFITASFAHVVFSVLFVINATGFNLKKLLKITIKVICFVLFLYLIDSPLTALLDSFISRFGGGGGGTLIHDVTRIDQVSNRANYLINAGSYVNLKVAFFGRDGACILNAPGCASYEHGSYGENPLTLLVHWGLTLSWLYYAALTYLLVRAKGSQRWVLLGVFALLLQRPNILSYGYSVIIVLYVYLLHRYQSTKALGGAHD